MLTLTYALLDDGRAQVTLSNGGEFLTLVVSYAPSSALDHLVDAMISLLQGPGEVSFRWYEEPGEYQVVLTRHDDMVKMRVLERRVLGRRPGDQQWAQIFAAEELPRFHGQGIARRPVVVECTSSQTPGGRGSRAPNGAAADCRRPRCTQRGRRGPGYGYGTAGR